MNMNILVCDRCDRRQPKNAVATLTLVNGKPRRDSPTLDLCPTHLREVEAVFRVRVRSAIGRPSAKPRAKSEPTDLQARLLGILTRDPVLGIVLAREAKADRGSVYRALATLVKQKKVVRHGERKGYSLAKESKDG
jgi:hypothetical protein